MKILIALVLIVLIPTVTRADEKGEVGRYQLFYAVTETSSQEKTLWKIDTVTGQVWQFKKTLLEHFAPVETEKP